MHDTIPSLPALPAIFSVQAIAEELTSQFTVRTFPAPDCTFSDNFNYRLYVIMQVCFFQLSQLSSTSQDFIHFTWIVVDDNELGGKSNQDWDEKAKITNTYPYAGYYPA